MKNFSIIKVTKESYSAVFGNLAGILPLFLQFILISILFFAGIYMVAGDFWSPSLQPMDPQTQPDMMPDMTGSLWLLLFEVLLYWAMVPVLVAIFRNVMFNEAYDGSYFPKLLEWRSFRMVYYPFLVYFVFMIVGTIFILILTFPLSFLLGGMAGGAKVVMPIVMTVGVLPVLYFMTRIYLIMPLIAIDDPSPLKTSFALTKGKVLKMLGAIIMTMLPALFIVILFILAMAAMGLGMGMGGMDGMEDGPSMTMITLGIVGVVLMLFLYFVPYACVGIMARELGGREIKKLQKKTQSTPEKRLSPEGTESPSEEEGKDPQK